ncbi:PREDICTED: mitochondrial ribosome-associated GTPase 1-like [Acropora digitifera]|uniref:mitochondrial ribosome-associated GTPase 1-like n=1 Tax=Acropora digitifera TaxID=70779 RepID=UPI00077A773F|nr:PREDICTED: mitochondrial ribosome-associated GTPase 1-like [Acropora digitifera]
MMDIVRCLRDDGIRAIFTDSKSQYHYSIKKVIPTALEAIKDAEYEGTYIRSEPDKPYNILICGLPNTGKSSLINALRRKYMRKGKATKVGAVPGITKSIQERIKVCDEPIMYMFDTPGITAPYIPTVEVGMKLALIGCFKDHVVGEDLIADYLLFTLNKSRCFKFGWDLKCWGICFVLRMNEMLEISKLLLSASPTVRLSSPTIALQWVGMASANKRYLSQR